MKAAYIQPFVTAAVNVLRSELGTEVKRGQLALETTYYSMNDIVVLIGITGEIEGTVVYATDEDVAKKNGRADDRRDARHARRSL